MESKDLDENYCYSTKELAFRWNLSDETLRRIFLKEPGVMIFRQQQPGKRIYRTMRIPGAVAIRVKNRMTVVKKPRQ
ncbi:MAG TPA: hypothetical protein VJ276_03215 [Thermoanaerobaculia bacterium]|nr:hypothetical protein [Thermoanaerobaculia bacterium]